MTPWWEMPSIPVGECVERGIYELRSRNLVVGVYDANKRGFIGIREKMGSESLFMEFHYDNGPPLGTARPTRLLGRVPDEIELREYTDPVCDECGRACVFRPDVEGTRMPGRRYHIDDDTLVPNNMAHIAINQPLFDYLRPLTDSVLIRYCEECGCPLADDGLCRELTCEQYVKPRERS